MAKVTVGSIAYLKAHWLKPNEWRAMPRRGIDGKISYELQFKTDTIGQRFESVKTARGSTKVYRAVSSAIADAQAVSAGASVHVLSCLDAD